MPSFNQQDVDQVRLLLRESQNEDDIVAALDLVGVIGTSTAVPDMMRHIEDTRPAVKSALESALLAIGQEAIPAIVDYLPMLEPKAHISLQALVEVFWKDANANQIRRMMNHEDNRVRWAMAWTLSKPLRTIPPEEIAYIFEGLGDESVTAIRWAATQSLTALVYSSESIPPELIRVALPVMVDNFKYGDVNLSESSVQAIAILTTPPHPAITAMLASSDAELQVAAVKVLTVWVQDEKVLDDETMDALKTAMKSPNWLMENEVARLRYVLSISFPEALKVLEGVPDTGKLSYKAKINPDDEIRTTNEIMLPPLDNTTSDE